jgi:hypothetical protein
MSGATRSSCKALPGVVSTLEEGMVDIYAVTVREIPDGQLAT